MNPGSGARDQVARLLSLVPYLLSRGEVEVDEAARHFGVPAKTLVKDLKVLFMVGLPGGLPDDLIDVDLEALQGEGVIRVSNADYLGRPVRFAPAEATALVVALSTLVEQADAATRPLLERTLDKVTLVAGAGPQGASMHVQPDGPAHPHQAALQRAIDARRQVRISYYVPARDETSERVVEPRTVASVDGQLYLDAWCTAAGGDRVFRLDRILEAAELDTPVSDANARPRDLTRDWFAGGQTTPVTVRLAPAAAWVPEYFASSDVSVQPDGSTLATLQAASTGWIERLLGRLAPHVEVVAPADVAAAHAARLERALALYSTGGLPTAARSAE